MLHWTEQLPRTADTILLKSPVTGQVLPLSEHPEPLYHNGILPLAVCIRLEHGIITAPFNCLFSRRLNNGRRLSFRHHSGFTLQLELPQEIATFHGAGLISYVETPAEVKAQQQVMQLDLQRFRQQGQLYAIVMPEPFPRLHTAHCRQRKVLAGQDILYSLELNQKTDQTIL